MFVMLFYRKSKFMIGLTALLIALSPFWLDISSTYSSEPKAEQPDTQIQYFQTMAMQLASNTGSLPLETQTADPKALLYAQNQDASAQSQEKPAPQSSEAMDLSNATRLRIKFLGYTELTGEYNISSDKMISFPVLGRVSIDSLDTAQLEKILAGKVSKVTKRDAYVSVDVIEYKPVFVNGFVVNPGSYPWKPGMNVIQAITISGGLYRERMSERENSALLLRNVNEEKMRLRNAVGELKITLAILARHQAELKDSSKIETPKRLIELVGQSEANKLIETQNVILNSSQSTIRTQFEAFQGGIAEAEVELKGLQDQKEIVEKQLSLQREIMKGIQSLRVQQNVNNSRFLTEQVRVMEIEERGTTSIIELARAKGRLLNLQREMSTAKLRQQAEIVAQIERLERIATQQETTISAAQAAYRNLTGQDVSTSDNRDKPSIHYTIARHTGNGTETLNANQFTELQPGDILMIESGNQEASPSNQISQR